MLENQTKTQNSNLDYNKCKWIFTNKYTYSWAAAPPTHEYKEKKVKKKKNHNNLKLKYMLAQGLQSVFLTFVPNYPGPASTSWHSSEPVFSLVLNLPVLFCWFFCSSWWLNPLLTTAYWCTRSRHLWTGYRLLQWFQSSHDFSKCRPHFWISKM